MLFQSLEMNNIECVHFVQLCLSFYPHPNISDRFPSHFIRVKIFQINFSPKNEKILRPNSHCNFPIVHWLAFKGDLAPHMYEEWRHCLISNVVAFFSSILIRRPNSDICGVGHPWAPAQCQLVEQRGRPEGFHPRSPAGGRRFRAPVSRWVLMLFYALDPSLMLRGTLVVCPIGCSSELVRVSWPHLLIQRGRRKTEDQWPKVSCSSEVLVHHIVFKVDLSSL